MENEIRMYFAVYGDWPEPDAISAVMGCAPTSFRAKGDAIARSSMTVKRSIWALDSGAPSNADIEDHLASLLVRLEERAEAVRSVATNENKGIQCAAYWYTAQPGFHLSEELVSRVASLGLSIDFDMYCLCEDEESTGAV